MKYKISLAKCFFFYHILRASHWGNIIFMEKNKMKSVSLALVVLFGTLSFANANTQSNPTEENTKPVVAVEEEIVVDEAEGQPASQQ